MRGVRFSYEFSTGSLGTTPDNGVITIDRSDDYDKTHTSEMVVTGIMAVKIGGLNTAGARTDMVILTRQETCTCVYRIESRKVIMEKYSTGDHWTKGYDSFVRHGGWAGILNDQRSTTDETIVVNVNEDMA